VFAALAVMMAARCDPHFQFDHLESARLFVFSQLPARFKFLWFTKHLELSF
jgi:hypothetical protein